MIAHGNSSIDFNMTSDVYIKSLCRGGSNRDSKDSLKRSFTSLTLEERLQTLFRERSRLLRYSVLKHYAPDVSDEEFLTVLQEYAVLVQGLWTPKTNKLKLDGAAEASRDWVIYLFSKDSIVKYSEVEATGRLRDKVKATLTDFPKERPLLCDWKFKEHTDVSFVKMYGEIVDKQYNALKALGNKFRPMITQGGKGRGDNSRSVVGKNTSATVKPETPITLSDKGESSRNTIPRVVRQKMPEETRRALPKALKRVFQTHKVCR